MGRISTIVCSAICAIFIAGSAMAQGSSVRLSDTSNREAMEWSKTYPGIAVNVILGTESKITPQQIEEVLNQEFAEAGVSEVVYFYRQNDMRSTVVVYYYSGSSDGPFVLNEAREEARKSASQYLYQQSHPALKYDYPG